MKKFIFVLVVIVFAATSCKNKQPDVYTILGEATPFANVNEKLNGKVEKVAEKYYWAIPDGNSFKKGNHVTDHERDSLKWGKDWECTFDSSGDIKTCFGINDNNKIIWMWEFFKENNILISAKLTNMDTLSQSVKLKCNSDGAVIEALRFRPVVDTLISTWTYKFNSRGDTLIRQNYNLKGIPTYYRVSVVGKDGQFLNTAFYNRNKSYTGGNDNIFDEKGNFIGWTLYDKDKKVTAKWILSDFEYDNNDNWIKAVLKDASGKSDIVSIVERTYTYFE
jgi:hypothetical protein